MNIEFDEIIITLGPAILAILGFLLLGYRLAVIKEGFYSLSWSKTKGKILSSELDVNETLVENSTSKSYRADITYSYVIDRKEFVGKQVYCGDDLYNSFSEKPTRLVKQYPKGEETIVFYNPYKFEEAVLIRGIKPINWLNVILVSGIMIVGLWFLDTEAVMHTINELSK